MTGLGDKCLLLYPANLGKQVSTGFLTIFDRKVWTFK